LAFWDAMLWASAQRAGVSRMLTEYLQDGFTLQDVTFINPFKRENNALIDKLLPRS
jgi:predicted nucleic acid-binding protein